MKVQSHRRDFRRTGFGGGLKGTLRGYALAVVLDMSGYPLSLLVSGFSIGEQDAGPRSDRTTGGLTAPARPYEDHFWAGLLVLFVAACWLAGTAGLAAGTIGFVFALAGGDTCRGALAGTGAALAAFVGTNAACVGAAGRGVRTGVATCVGATGRAFTGAAACVGATGRGLGCVKPCVGAAGRGVLTGAATCVGATGWATGLATSCVGAAG